MGIISASVSGTDLLQTRSENDLKKVDYSDHEEHVRNAQRRESGWWGTKYANGGSPGLRRRGTGTRKTGHEMICDIWASKGIIGPACPSKEGLVTIESLLAR